MSLRALLGIATLVACTLLSARAHAEELRTEHFVFRPTPRAEGMARRLAPDIESVRAEFETLLGHPWPGVTEIRVGVGRREFEALCPSGTPPAWASALAFPEAHVVVLEATALLGPEGPSILRHELTHAALGELGGPWPRWFHEGLAMRLSGEALSVAQYAALFRGVTQDHFFHFADLARSWPEAPPDVELAYAQSASFVAFLTGRYGPDRFAELLQRVEAGDAFELAFAKAFHSSLDVDERDWRASLPARYSWVPILTGEATLWFVVAVGTILAYARRRAAFARWRQEQEALERAEDEAAVVHLYAEAEAPQGEDTLLH